MKKYKCVFIPGGGLLPDGSLPPWTLARLDRALSLHSQARWIALLSGGTVHKPPPLTKEGFPIFEARAAAAYLASRGVDPRQLLTEISSYDTIGNAYYSRLLFAEPMALHKLLVITSEFHLPRTRMAFEWVYGLLPQTIEYQLDFESVPDQGLSPQALNARKTSEQISLEKLRMTQDTITTLASFQTWFYTEHSAYAVKKQPDKLSGDVLASY